MNCAAAEKPIMIQPGKIRDDLGDAGGLEAVDTNQR